MQEVLSQGDQVQIITSDPDSRQLITRNQITEVAYNIQSTVDAKHNIPIDFKVTIKNDSKAMDNMVRRAKTILKTTNFTALYDKGYHKWSLVPQSQWQNHEPRKTLQNQILPHLHAI